MVISHSRHTRAILCGIVILLDLSCFAHTDNASSKPNRPQTAILSTLATVPIFTSPAVARSWGEAKEQAGRYDLASDAFLQESALRDKMHDLQGAEVERRRALRLATTVSVGIPVSLTGTPDGLAKLEPASGCYFGSLDTPSEGRTFDGESVVDSFEKRVGKPVAIAFRYLRYGQDFPFAWARDQAKKGRAIEIAMEPYDIYNVSDDEYLEGFAADLNQSGVDCFLRFGGEMNGFWAPWGKDPDAYRRAFRTVHDVMAHFAPRCAMVWAPNMMPLDNIDKYYPGDDVVDWVGLSLYLVKYYDDDPKEPGWQDNPATYIDPFYKKYCARKPMCLVECGVTRESHIEGKPCDKYAAARIDDLLSAIKIRYPRLKMFCWFDRNNLGGSIPDRRLNDFSLPPDSDALAAFKTDIADPYFLSRPPRSNVDDDQVNGIASYQPVGSEFPYAYDGHVSLSISTYSLYPTVEIRRGSNTIVLSSRPFEFDMPEGDGPIQLTVRDESGNAAKTTTYFIARPSY